MNAPAPTRATTSTTIGWGLISIPVSLYTGTEDSRVERKEFVDGTDHEVGRRPYDKATGQNVEQSDVVRRARSTDGVWVDLSDDEIATATENLSGRADIEALVPLSAIGTFLVPTKLYQVRAKGDPKKGGSPIAEKAFYLLLLALTDRNEGALIKFAVRGSVARYGVLTPQGDLYVVEYDEGVRARRPIPSKGVEVAELEAASALLDTLPSGIPSLPNTTAEQVQTYVDAKAKGVTVTATKAPATDEVSDILGALQVAIDQAKSKVVAP